MWNLVFTPISLVSVWREATHIQKRRFPNEKMVEPRGYVLSYETTIVVVHFAHASPWSFTIPITNYSQLDCFQYILGNKYS